MKTLWNVVSFLAVIHLLAILMFVGWLAQSGRLNADRLQQVRTLLAATVTEAEHAAQSKAAAEETARTEALAQAKDQLPSITSESQVGLALRVDERAALVSRRMADEQHQLMAQVDLHRNELEQQVKKFETDKASWIAAVGAEQKRKIDEQFLKAVAQYEAVPAKQAKQMLQQLVKDGQKMQAVSYLDAMDPRAAKKILSEFTSPADIQLATELLEKVRTLGTPAGSAGAPSVVKDTSHADAASSSRP